MNSKKFGEGCTNYDAIDPIKNLISAWHSVVPNLKQGWHTATVTFELDAQGDMTKLDEIKVCSFGGSIPKKLATEAIEFSTLSAIASQPEKMAEGPGDDALVAKMLLDNSRG